MRKKNKKIGFIELFDIKKIIPIIYKKCDACGDSIKLEKIWEVKVYSPRWGNTEKYGNHYKYFCTQCFNEHELLKEYCRYMTRYY